MRFHVLREGAGETVEIFLLKLVGIGPRAALKRALSASAVHVNGRPAPRTQRVSEGDVIEIAGPESAQLYERDQLKVAPAPADAPLTVVTSSPRLLIIDKAAGQSAHPLSPTETDTALSAIVAAYPTAGNPFRPDRPLEGGLVHRLDRGTSGLLACALNADGFAALRAAWSSGPGAPRAAIEKVYLAWLDGEFELTGRIELALAHDPKSSKRMTAHVSEGMKSWPAITSIRTIKSARHASGDRATLALLRIHTGVTHQIRATAAMLGHPVLADHIYGGEGEARRRRLPTEALDPVTKGVFEKVSARLKTLTCPLEHELPAKGFFLHAFYLRAPSVSELNAGVFAEPPEHFG